MAALRALFLVLLLVAGVYSNEYETENKTETKSCDYCLEASFIGKGADFAKENLGNTDDLVSCGKKEKRKCDVEKGEDTCKEVQLEMKVTGELGNTELDITWNMNRMGCMEANVTCDKFMKEMGNMELGTMKVSVQDCEMSGAVSLLSCTLLSLLSLLSTLLL